MSTGTAKGLSGLAIGLLVGGLCLFLTFRNVSLSELREGLTRLDAMNAALFVAALLIQFFLRTARWRIQVFGVSRKWPKMKDSLAVNAVAFAAVFLMPLRLGEFVRPRLSERRGFTSFSEGLGNSLVERIVDGMLTSILLFVVFATLDNTIHERYMSFGLVVLLIFGVAAVSAALAVRWKEATLSFWQRVLFFVPSGLRQKLVGLLEAFVDGVRCFASPAHFGLYLFLSSLFWGVNGIALFMLLHGMGLEISVAGSYFTICFMVVAMMLPAPPGNIGNFQYFTQLALIQLGVGSSAALAAALVVYGLQVVALVFWAALFLLVGAVHFSEMTGRTNE